LHDVMAAVKGSTYVLDEGTLVLEGVTLAQVVELVVEVLVDLAGGAVLDEQTTEDTETTHPHDLAVLIHQHSTSNRCRTPLPSISISLHLFRQIPPFPRCI